MKRILLHTQWLLGIFLVAWALLMKWMVLLPHTDPSNEELARLHQHMQTAYTVEGVGCVVFAASVLCLMLPRLQGITLWLTPFFFGGCVGTATVDKFGPQFEGASFFFAGLCFDFVPSLIADGLKRAVPWMSDDSGYPDLPFTHNPIAFWILVFVWAGTLTTGAAILIGLLLRQARGKHPWCLLTGAVIDSRFL